MAAAEQEEEDRSWLRVRVAHRLLLTAVRLHASDPSPSSPSGYTPSPCTSELSHRPSLAAPPPPPPSPQTHHHHPLIGATLRTRVRREKSEGDEKSAGGKLPLLSTPCSCPCPCPCPCARGCNHTCIITAATACIQAATQVSRLHPIRQAARRERRWRAPTCTLSWASYTASSACLCGRRRWSTESSGAPMFLPPAPLYPPPPSILPSLYPPHPLASTPRSHPPSAGARREAGGAPLAVCPLERPAVQHGATARPRPRPVRRGLDLRG
jgi:hypothetical protein